MRISRETMFMEMAELVAQRSVCPRLQVGAVVTLSGRVLSIGYNGPESGVEHSSVCSCIHAEMNAIAWAARNGIALEGSTMYVTHAPCPACAKLIINSGVSSVVYRNEYRSEEGVILLGERIRKYDRD